MVTALCAIRPKGVSPDTPVFRRFYRTRLFKQDLKAAGIPYCTSVTYESVKRPCHYCAGSGTDVVYKNACRKCNGTGNYLPPHFSERMVGLCFNVNGRYLGFHLASGYKPEMGSDQS